MSLRLLFLIMLFPFAVAAQTGKITGQLTDDSGNALPNVTVLLKGAGYSATTSAEGGFEIINVPFGDYTLMIDNPAFGSFSKSISLNAAVLNLEKVSAEGEQTVQTTADDLPVVSVDEEESESKSEQSVSSVLGASRDVFASAANFNWSIARFKARGYDDVNSITLMNGIEESDLYNGRTAYSSWSGLNDVLRSRENTRGLTPANYSFGSVGGTSSIDSRATRQRKQLSATYGLSNRTYDNRFMLTYGSGILNKGWAFSASISRRWANEGFVKGTYYDGFAYYAGISKIINKHELSLTMLASSVESARSSANTQEVYDLTGDNYYNSNWGYQGGKVRNSNIGTNYQPLYIFSHDWKISNKSSLTSAVSYTSGKRGSTSLNWIDAPDPRPTYYRYLPSYYEDAALAAFTEQKLKNNPDLLQIQWDDLVAANYRNIETVNNVDGIAGNSVTGRKALYIIENRITETQRQSISTYYATLAGDNVTINAGANYQSQSSRFYKEIEDLLGADFYLDIDKYAAIDFQGDPSASQNDLNNPNRIVREGDKFGYDYEAHVSKVNVWSQANAKFDRIDVFGAISTTSTTMFREGNYKNGLFPDNSFGKSEKLRFSDIGLKGGATYKVNGRNYLFANAAYLTRAPLFDNVFVSPRTRDVVVDDVTNEKITSVEGGYLYTAPRLKAKAVFYHTIFNDAIENRSFYLDYGSFKSYINYTLTDIERTHSGTELSVDANLGKGFSATAAAAIGSYFYSSRPLATITIDNTNTVNSTGETVYIKNLHVELTPQNAYAFGVNYRSTKFWNVGLSANYFANSYFDFSPARRTDDALQNIEKDSETWKNLLSQQRTDGQFTLDLSAGWSYKLNNKFKSLKRNTFFLVYLNVNNLLDNTDIITNGYEQGRLDRVGYTERDVDIFAPKFSYAFGRTYMLSFILRMN
ncbi:MAG TPA: TonB-dependent receptor [Bacteroidia bacterium]|nr:TonB-dependent receptor [Bacteroidia bacterium]HNU32861.1 TonB-dependent receptor [Bacteroidia bacterium]